jgi:hypothetical protein
MNASVPRPAKGFHLHQCEQSKGARVQSSSMVDPLDYAELRMGRSPKLLIEKWADLSDTDRRECLAEGFVRTDNITDAILASDWIRMFREVGPFKHPIAFPSDPDLSNGIYRAATRVRRLGLSWTTDLNSAAVFGKRHAMHGDAFLYAAQVPDDGLLANLYRSDDFAWTIVIDPCTLLDVREIGPLGST